MTVKEIRRKTLPEVDDELALDMGHETLDALRADLRGKIADEKARVLERNYKERIVRSLVEAHPVEIPESLVERRVGGMILQAHMDLIQAEDTERLKALSERLRPVARDQIRGELVLEKIAGAEGSPRPTPRWTPKSRRWPCRVPASRRARPRRSARRSSSGKEPGRPAGGRPPGEDAGVSPGAGEDRAQVQDRCAVGFGQPLRAQRTPRWAAKDSKRDEDTVSLGSPRSPR